MNQTDAPSSGSDDRRPRVLLVDDQPITCYGLAALIRQQPDLEVCGWADDASTGLDLLQKLEPDLAVVDISRNGASAIDFVKNALAMRPRLQVLMLSSYDEQLYAPRAFRAGARGYIMKHEPIQQIVEAMRRIRDGGVYISPGLKEDLAERALLNHSSEVEDPIGQLSDREVQVFELIGDGYTTRQIARRLCLSVKTIDSHRDHLKAKLQVNDAPALLQRAIHWTRAKSPG